MLTYVGGYDEGLALGAVRRELLREGQVFWVHNRVATIDRQAAWLQRQLPEARIVVAHGQMDEDALERQMVRFWDREADVLVCTTIIESGLDVPNANTLDRRPRRQARSRAAVPAARAGGAERRARVRVLLLPTACASSPRRRTSGWPTISRHQALGAGFRIALRDLEIRGAGNLLGAEQHGHIAAVGFDAYCRILQRVGRRAAGASRSRRSRSSGSTCRSKAFVPPGWVAQEALRLELYRRISLAGGPRRARADPRRDRRPVRRAARRRWRRCSRSPPCG